MTNTSTRTSGVHVNSYILVGLIILGSSLLYVFTAEKKTASQATGASFRLLSSSVFQQLKACVDISDGHACFDRFREKLETEYKAGASPFSHVHLKQCLDTAGRNVSDIDILLGIQSCFHQADVFELAVAPTTRQGASWVVKMAMAASVIIQILVGGHYFVAVLLRTGDLEDLDKQMQKFAQNLHFQSERQEEIRETAATLASTIRSETRNIQGRLNRGGDVRRDLERLYHAFEATSEECKKLNSYVFSFYNTSTAAIVPPKSYMADLVQQSDSSTSENIEQGQVSNISQHVTVAHDNLPSTLQFAADNINALGDKSYVTHHDSKKLSFDISTPEGRDELKEYIKSNLSGRPLAEVDETQFSGSQDNQSGNKGSIKDIGSTQNEPLKITNRLRYQDVSKCDPNNKRFKRIFISGRGWVSSKKLEEEEMLYGSSSFVRLDDE